jgi:PAS domain S-box-containing protein
LVKSEQLYRTLAANIPNAAIGILDKDMRYVLSEGPLLKVLGFDKRALIGKSIAEIVSPERFEFIRPYIERMMKGETIRIESRPYGLDHLMQFVPLLDAEGNVELGMVIVHDITDLKDAQRQVQDMNRNLESLVQERTEQLSAVNKELEAFSYSVSHDLRAPLRAIDGYARMLEEDHAPKLDEEGRRLLGVVQYNAQRMGKLIDDLLAFSRLGKKEIQMSEIDMNELFQRVVDDAGRSQPHHAKIIIDDLPAVNADYALISQVAFNLVSNALKYSSKKEEPEVKISAEKKEDQVVYKVSDNGDGFDMKYYHRLFGVFQRLHNSDEFEGTGVGLAMVQRIISRHNGKIWAEAESGKGADFYFSLPVT